MSAPFDRLRLIIQARNYSAPVNMAIDEALLKASEIPVLRFYGWQSPAASFGYFEPYAPVAERFGDRELVRRWTGGGTVEHGEDTTYSVIVPAREECFLEMRAEESYLRIHEELSAAMAACGVAAETALEKAASISNACFENPVRHDVMQAGRKIAGAAQRRTQLGMLHQGSIQRVALPPAFAGELAKRLGAQVETGDLDADILRRAQALAEAKYGTEAWLRKY